MFPVFLDKWDRTLIQRTKEESHPERRGSTGYIGCLSTPYKDMLICAFA